MAVMYGGLVMLMVLYVMIIAAAVLMWVADYVFMGLGLYGVAKNHGHDKPWLAWIPYAREYLQGQLAGDIVLGKHTLKNPGRWLLGMHLGIYVIGIGFTIVLVVLQLTGTLALSVGNSHALGASSLVGGFFAYLLMFSLLIVLSIGYSVVLYLINFRIFKRYTGLNMSVLHTILAATIPLYQSIFYMMLRKRNMLNIAADRD